MIQSLRLSIKENKGHFVVMVSSFLMLILLFKSNLDKAIEIIITWSFAISSHKLIIEGVVHKKIEKKK